MQRINLFAGMSVVAVLAFGGMVIVPVSAETGRDGGLDDRATRVQGRDGAVRTKISDDQIAVTSTEIREKGSQKLREERQGKQLKTAEQRQKSCEARSAAINRKLTNYSRHAEKHLATFDKIYDRVQSFQEAKKLSATDYVALVAAADAKQLAAAETIAALDEIATTVDCNSEDPAAALAAVKEGVIAAKTSLKDYRTAIKDVIRSLKAAPETADSTTDSSDTGSQTDTDNTTANPGSETN